MSDHDDPSPTPRRKRKTVQTRSLHKREQILEAAMKVFARHGPQKTTIEDIARKAGIGKATLYYHFDGKEEVFEAVVDREIDLVFGVINRAVEREKDPASKLRVYIQTALSEGRKRRSIARMWRQDLATWSPLGVAKMQSLFERSTKTVADILEQGRREGVFHLPSSEQPAKLMVAMLHGLGQVQLMIDEEILADVQVDGLAAFALLALTNPDTETLIKRFVQTPSDTGQ